MIIECGEKTLAATMKHKVSTTFQIVFDVSLKAKTKWWFFTSSIPDPFWGSFFFLLPMVSGMCLVVKEMVFIRWTLRIDGFSVHCAFWFNQPVKAHKNTHQTFENIAPIFHPVEILLESFTSTSKRVFFACFFHGMPFKGDNTFWTTI